MDHFGLSRILWGALKSPLGHAGIEHSIPNLINKGEDNPKIDNKNSLLMAIYNTHKQELGDNSNCANSFKLVNRENKIKFPGIKIAILLIFIMLPILLIWRHGSNESYTSIFWILELMLPEDGL